MIDGPGSIDPSARLRFYVRVVDSEARHLALTDSRLFSVAMSPERVASLDRDVQLAEQVDAFVARFGRLQDTLADKLLPALLERTAERTGTVIDNLDRAEKLGWLRSVEDWMAVRKLRTRVIHDDVLDPAEPAAALSAAHVAVSTLLETAATLSEETTRRLDDRPAS